MFTTGIAVAALIVGFIFGRLWELRQQFRRELATETRSKRNPRPQKGHGGLIVAPMGILVATALRKLSAASRRAVRQSRSSAGSLRGYSPRPLRSPQARF